ncbi:MAG: dTDP-4-dehydrorhamnose reductase [Candidatus Eisenbacteria bacterium]|uniref:dTDP-4-dehydrorhamnose reductase n=1 Tax=Eiseniibacteriota bacterium TaxID=2212470 RepID=A0A9D6QLQ0_UNCEI|nr:dTDP-4-dehydrorhamnose reductase [Candidatus Eisenbacteria bacterium]MBI3538898.1 dTDP-4-dehydrorhamnose reductase [Candidatus Eisenbacteria bacterium]
MLGTALVPALERAGHRVLALARADADVTDIAALRRHTRAFRPEWVFHLAAFTRVDDCEREPERAWRVNALGARNAAQAAAEAGAGVLAISTDYVFGGDARAPYDEYAPTAPRSVYGASKRGGEEAVRAANPRHAIVRTAWLFGAGGANFIDTVLARARAGEPLRVVDDQTGSPTWTADLAVGLVQLATAGAVGTYHCTAAGACTWHGLAAELLAHQGLDASLEPIDSATLGRPAPRPAYSVLSCDRFEKATGHAMPEWKDAVHRYLALRAAPEPARAAVGAVEG